MITSLMGFAGYGYYLRISAIRAVLFKNLGDLSSAGINKWQRLCRTKFEIVALLRSIGRGSRKRDLCAERGIVSLIAASRESDDVTPNRRHEKLRVLPSCLHILYMGLSDNRNLCANMQSRIR